MPGVKGKSGGKRSGTGRHATVKPVATLALGKLAQRQLAILTEERRQLGGNTRLSQREVVEQLIAIAWSELDQAIQNRADELSSELN